MKKIAPELIVIGALWICAVTSGYHDTFIGDRFLLGIIGLVVSTILLIRYTLLVLYLLLLLLLLSFVEIIAFSNTNYYFGFNGFKVNLISTSLLIYLCFKRRNVIRQWYADRNSSNDVAATENRKMALFKREFENESTYELEKRLEKGNLVPEARTALTEILNDRSRE
ncbi:MAG: hypothetical protein CFE24_12065 [Flavobacterium sp. BFFFF2]|nr:MAG: hypothetical protein CFE24_12065 [Flavobacterium sp. BFFFF2]